MLLLIDNYDSFVHNLARYFIELGCEAHVVRNDAVTVAEVLAMNPSAIVISPGPCTPAEAGITMQLIREVEDRFHCWESAWDIKRSRRPWEAESFASEPVHGRTSSIHHDGTRLFGGLLNPMQATRYYLLIIDEATLPRELMVTARTIDRVPMALVHRSWPTFGVQFHPESVLTRQGRLLLSNFLDLAGLPHRPTSLIDWDGRAETLDDLPRPPLVTW